MKEINLLKKNYKNNTYKTKQNNKILLTFEMLIILSGHPSTSLENSLSNLSEGMLIWCNLILDFGEISTFHITPN